MGGAGIRIVIFTHSLRSDWNHGHVHVLRGLVRDLLARGHQVRTMEPEDGWSAQNLQRDHGAAGLRAYEGAYPGLAEVVGTYPESAFDATSAVRDADLVIVQEWTAPHVVQALAEARARLGNFRLLFHDAHHRSVTQPGQLAALGLSEYDAVLAFGNVVRDQYLANGWTTRAYTWHEAADAEVFRPLPAPHGRQQDLVWVGNWGDGERTEAFEEFLFGPARTLGLDGTVQGVRYPPEGRAAVRRAGLRYGGYLPNHRVPEVFAAHRLTVHLPREVYRQRLPGVPTIRVFESLACGIPLVSAPWQDAEGLFRRGHDYVTVQDGAEMRDTLRHLLDDPDAAARIAANGRATVLSRHTTQHRIDELFAIDARLRGGQYPVQAPAGAAPVPQAAEVAIAGGAGPAAAPALAATAARGGTAQRDGAGLRIAFFGSSLVSSYWNGAATYYRGLLRALARRGCRITFYEPDAWDRQKHRDMPDPEWARVVVYPSEGQAGVDKALAEAAQADLVVKASGVGVHDEYLERAVARLADRGPVVAYWDVDAPATLERMARDPHDALRAQIPLYDLVFTYGGGPPVVREYLERGAAQCLPVYNALDPDTHHPVPPDERYRADLSFLGNRLPDREARVEQFFLDVARAHPQRRFLLGGSGWDAASLPGNVQVVGHVPTAAHNAWNTSARAVLNIHRESMARCGWSPATRVFEAAGAAACLITDASPGLEAFFTPGREILLAQDGDEVAAWLDDLDGEEAAKVGERARRRALAEHTYDRRAGAVLEALRAAGAGVGG